MKALDRHDAACGAVASLVMLPSAICATLGIIGIVWSPAVLEAHPVAAIDEVGSVPLQPGVLYRMILDTECIVGRNYSVQLAVWNDAAELLPLNAKGSLGFTRTECRAGFESREFTVPVRTTYTVGWNLSDEVFAHKPSVRLVVVTLTLDDSLDLIVGGLWSGLCATPLAIAIFGWLRKRPPRLNPWTRSAPSGARSVTP